MLEAMWSAMHGWFTPSVLFVLVNLVVATIAVASRSTVPSSPAASGNGEHRTSALLRAPSVAFDRLRSFSFSRHHAPQPFDFDGTTDSTEVEVEHRSSALLRAPSVAFDRLRSFSFSRLRAEYPASPAPEPEPFDEAVDTEPPHSPPAEPEREHGHEEAHMERSRSEAAAAGETPRLPTRLRKSASERSAFAHFAQEEDDEEEVLAVEARRPATARDAAVVGGDYGEEDGSRSPVEVDERADDFIKQFREQLRLQRLDSICATGTRSAAATKPAPAKQDARIPATGGSCMKST